MRPRFSRWEWFAILVSIALLIVILTGCTHRGSLPGGATETPLHGIPRILQQIAGVVASMAALTLILCGVALWFIPNKLTVAKFALAALGALISAGILWELAEYWAWAMGLAGLALAGGAVGYAWLHRKDIERRTGIDLNRDGRLG